MEPTIHDIMQKLQAIENLLKAAPDITRLRCITAFAELKTGEAFLVPDRNTQIRLYTWARKNGIVLASAKTRDGYIIIRGRKPKRRVLHKL